MLERRRARSARSSSGLNIVILVISYRWLMGDGDRLIRAAVSPEPAVLVPERLVIRDPADVLALLAQCGLVGGSACFLGLAAALRPGEDPPCPSHMSLISVRFVIRSPAHRAFNESPGTLKIIKAAKRVFECSGGSTFSIRNVAREAGMSVGAVQHYYPARDKLLAAVLEYVANEFDDAYERVFGSLPSDSEARLKGVIDLTLDLCSQTRSFFFSLWALSCHNKFAATLIDESYLHHRRNLAALIGAARPMFSKERCFEAATGIAAILDGLMIFTGPGMRHGLDQASLTRTARTAVAQLLREEPAAGLPSKSGGSGAREGGARIGAARSRKRRDRGATPRKPATS